MYEDKRAEYEEKQQYNEKVRSERELREKIAKEVSHKVVSDILNWLDGKVGLSANMDVSDFGYELYTPNNP